MSSGIGNLTRVCQILDGLASDIQKTVSQKFEDDGGEEGVEELSSQGESPSKWATAARAMKIVDKCLDDIQLLIKTTEVVSGISVLSAPEGSYMQQLGEGMAEAAGEAKKVINLLSAPAQGTKVLAEIVQLGANCKKSIEEFNVFDRIDAIRRLLFTEILKLGNQIIDGAVLYSRHVQPLSQEAMNILKSVGAVFNVTMALNGIASECLDLHEKVCREKCSRADIGLALLEIAKNTFYLTVGALTMAVIFGGVAFASPWIIFAFVVAAFVMTLGAFFVKNAFDIKKLEGPRFQFGHVV